MIKQRLNALEKQLAELDTPQPGGLADVEWHRLEVALSEWVAWVADNATPAELAALTAFIANPDTLTWDNHELHIAAALQRRSPAELVDAICTTRDANGWHVSRLAPVMPDGVARGLVIQENYDAQAAARADGVEWPIQTARCARTGRWGNLWLAPGAAWTYDAEWREPVPPAGL